MGPRANSWINSSEQRPRPCLGIGVGVRPRPRAEGGPAPAFPTKPGHLLPVCSDDQSRQDMNIQRLVWVSGRHSVCFSSLCVFHVISERLFFIIRNI